MNKKTIFPLVLVPIAATSLSAQSNIETKHATGKRPNIILFMVDDM